MEVPTSRNSGLVFPSSLEGDVPVFSVSGLPSFSGSYLVSAASSSVQHGTSK